MTWGIIAALLTLAIWLIASERFREENRSQERHIRMFRPGEDE